MSGWLRFLAGICLAAAVHSAFADIRFRKWEDEEDDKPKAVEEAPVVLPEYPKDENLLEFYVSASTSNRFFVDGASISPIGESIVRFTLVIKTGGGATNVTYEGIDCYQIKSKLYATGRADGTWSKARVSQWRDIVNNPINRQHAALNRGFFCPAGVPIKNGEEGRDALRRGKHPQAL